jgi:hypothetical protein
MATRWLDRRIRHETSRILAGMCGRCDTFGPVSVSREAKTVLDQIELRAGSEIHQHEDQFNIAPRQKALVIA